MSDSPRVRVYMGCSFDGFIAGVNDDLSWLDQAAVSSNTEQDDGGLVFDEFFSQIGSMLWGRRTYDVVSGFISAGSAPWFYGETPVLVATNRPLNPFRESVRAVSGDITQLVTLAKEAADENDVYIDGGDLIRQAIDAGLVDEMVITFVPVLLAEGISLFDGLVSRHSLEFVSHHHIAPNNVQVIARIRK